MQDNIGVEANIKGKTGSAHRLPAFIEEQRFLIAILTGFVVIGSVFLPNPQILSFPVITQFVITSILPVFYAVVAIVGYRAIRDRSLDGAMDYAFTHVLSRQNLAKAIPTIVVFGLFMMTFPNFKSEIPTLNPYAWDPYFAELDARLHFGFEPWRILESTIGYGFATVLLDKLYYLWFPVIFLAVGLAATAVDNRDLRNRFMISFAACWIIIGVIFAIVFSSVGPIFHDRLLGVTSDFSVLMAHLERVNAAVPLNTLVVRENLWLVYLNQTDSIISGISAMPSMHNAICVLMFLAARHVHHVLAIIAATYAILIFIGSVHLGWHYAIDGYVSAILTAIIWKWAGWPVKQQSPGFFGRVSK